MAMVFNMAGGGGGGGIKLKVAGGITEPSSPTENTIWIKTDETVTKYVLSPSQPKQPTSGLVWLRTSDEGTELSVGNHGEFLLHIWYASIYANSAWTTCDAELYVDGSWTELRAWTIVLNREEQTFNYITSKIKRPNSDDPSYTTITDDDPYVKFAVKTSSNVARYFGWNVAIDFSKYTLVRIVGYGTILDGCIVGAGSAIKSDSYNKYGSITIGTTEKEYLLDVSEASATGYITIRLPANKSTGNAAYIKSISLS